MRLLIKLFLAIFTIIIILLIALPILFKNNLVQIVKDEANKNLNATVDFGEFDLSLISSFPDFSFEINNISITGKEPFEDVELVNIGFFETTVDVMSVISGSKIALKTIGFQDVNVNVKVQPDGKANYDITVESTNEEDIEETNDETKFDIALKNYYLKNINISYIDKEGNMLAEILNLNHIGNGNFNQDVFVLQTNTTIDEFTYAMDEMNYIKKAKVDSKFDIEIDNTSSTYTFKENSISINQLGLNFTGWIKMPNDDIEMNLSFSSPEATFKSLLSMVPSVYMTDFETVETHGNFSFEGNANGIYSENSMPGFNLSLNVNDGFFKYPELPKAVENIFIDLSIDNKDGIEDHTIIDLKKFHIDLGENPVDFSLLLQNPISDPDMDGKLQMQINMESLAEVIPSEGESYAGSITVDAVFKGKLSTLEAEDYENFNAAGKFTILEFLYQDPSLDYDVLIKEALADFTPKALVIKSSDLMVGKSDFQFNGEITNYIAYSLQDSAVLGGKISMSSKLMDTWELGGFDVEETDVSTVEEEEYNYEDYVIPAEYDFVIDAEIDRITYDNIIIDNASGDLIIKDSRAVLNNSTMNVLDGVVKMDGYYAAPVSGKPEVDFGMVINDMDAQKSFETFNTIKKLAPIAENASGTFSSTFSMQTELNQNLEPDYNTMNGAGKLKTKHLMVESSGVLKKVSEVLKSDEFRKLELNDVNISFEIYEGKVEVDPFNVKYGGGESTISGTSYFDERINYLIQSEIPTKILGGAANVASSLLGNLNDKAGTNLSVGENIKVNLEIAGTLTDPSVKPVFIGAEGSKEDIKEQVKEAVKDKVKEEVDKVKEDVKENIEEKRAKLIAEAEKKGDQLIAAAEKQAGNIRKTAKKSASTIQSEAKKQAADLVKAAGINPVKKLAAEKAGDKLIEKADKKAQDIINEGDKKASSLIQKAKDQKAKLIEEAKNKPLP